MYPALAVAEAICANNPASELIFVGSISGYERQMVERYGLRMSAFEEVQAGPLHGVNPVRAAQSIAKLAIGTLQALRLLRRHKPQVVFSTGGWVSFPVTQAAWLLRIPIVIYLPDIEPGLTIKVLRSFAARIATSTPESAPYFNPKKMIVTGYPIGKRMVGHSRDEGITHFKLDPKRKTLFVNGGSLGARSINIALFDSLPQILLQDSVQVIHITGKRDWSRMESLIVDLDPSFKAHYHVFPYLNDDMGLAFAAADLVLCRAGASTLGELPFFGLAGILVPYPHAWRYQKVNATYLTEQGAALLMNDADMQSELVSTLNHLLFEDPEALDAMRTRSAALAVPDAAGNIAAILQQLGENAA